MPILLHIPRRAEHPEGTELNAIDPPLQSEQTASDPATRIGTVVLRWGLLVSYVVLVQTGVLDVTPRMFLLSAGELTLYNALVTIGEVHGIRTGRLYGEWYRLTQIYMDIVNTSLVFTALHDVRNPVWAVYFLSLVAVAHIVTRRQMAVYVCWAAVCYSASCVATAALGYEVSWVYASAVAGLLLFMGVNATIVAGGEQRRRELMAHIAVTDSLTGLPNRRRFHEAYVLNLENAIAAGTPLSLMLIDFDHFKEINDQRGHPAGDDKLREVAQALHTTVRRGDLVARYGGDEFVVVAPHATRADALALADRLRHAARACEASVSIGVAVYPEDAATQDDLLAAADAALYRAKQAGRNCVREAA